MNILEGEITYFGYNNKYGFIQSDIINDRIFFSTEREFASLHVNDRVRFELKKSTEGKYQAINIATIETFADRIKTKYGLTEEINAKSILESISKNWKLEAGLEKFKEYFYYNNELFDIINNDKCYIIGRKGSGKSSISEYLLNIRDAKVFSQKLSFKNFPFNELYSFDNKKYTPPNQYITIWKYLIYSHIAKLMVCNESIDSNVRSELAKIYSPDPINSLARAVERWTQKSFGVEILGCGGSLAISKEYANNEITWIERTNILEDIIVQYCDDSIYYIIFDELDEDYREFKTNDYQLYSYLITSLFKAVQDVKKTFSTTSISLKPLIFLRDDIYSLIKDADKNKWRDFKIEIEWDLEKIKKMLSHRLSIDAKAKTTIEFEDIFKLIFDLRNVKNVSPFDYITKSTHMRPRDFIRYFQVCADESLGRKNELIRSETILYVDRAFSNYLRDEIVDEIFPLLPEIEEIFQIMSNIGKKEFKYTDFIREYNKYLVKNTVTEKNIDFILDTLFKFSVIGNKSRKDNKNAYFKYIHTNFNLVKDEILVIHPGLYKVMQIPF